MTLSPNAGAALLAGGIAVVTGALLWASTAPDPAPAPATDCQAVWLQFQAADDAHQIAYLRDDPLGMAQARLRSAEVLAYDGGVCFTESLSAGAEQSLPVLRERVRAAGGWSARPGTAR